jgi:hypothetical protein
LAVKGCLAALEGEVAVKLKHGSAGIDKIGPLDLDLITSLRAKQAESREARAISRRIRVKITEFSVPIAAELWAPSAVRTFACTFRA